ncbi:hypothetical protein MATL_G00100930 [Megalops atlanticus]|uniref:Peptidase M12B propeptide domain-containing protein n=1 Tax=Megalops atlanticus TaxID=7932 RepID=A0A9D3Q537_MEGAT|nr:hypothetical protein MATL_G00100930 [Megalops atlanticus]
MSYNTTLKMYSSTADPWDETDLVVPLAVTKEAVHRQQNAFGRSGRGRSHRSTRQSEEDNLFLLLPVFGSELYLHLKRDVRFLSGGFVIEEKDEKGTTRLTQISDNQLCFYTGRILNHTNSFA